MLDNLTARTTSPIKASAHQRVARLDRELQITERARNAGIDNLPSAKDRDLDHVQHEVLDRAAQAIADQRHCALARLGNSALDQGSFNIDASERDFTDDEQNAYHAIRKLNGDASVTIRLLVVQQQRRARELAAFRHANRLGRDASYPDSMLMAVLGATIILLGEGVANASLFAATSEFGLIGGWLDALSFALPNFGIALCIGLIGLRYACHVHPLKRYFGLVVTFGLGSLVIAYNLWLAHYRELLTSAPASARSDAMPHLLANPLQINDGDALVLLLVGLATSLLAMADGYLGFADKYVGYTAVDRRFRAARAASHQARTEFRDQVRKAVAISTANITRKERSILRKSDALMRKIAAAAGLLVTFEQQVSNIQRAALLALRLYRDANCRVRSAPAPAYFDVYPSFDPRAHALSIDPGVDPRVLRTALEAEVGAILANAAAAKARLRQADQEANRRFDEFMGHMAADLDDSPQPRRRPIGLLGGAAQGADA
jgi:hypothetical protein